MGFNALDLARTQGVGELSCDPQTLQALLTAGRACLGESVPARADETALYLQGMPSKWTTTAVGDPRFGDAPEWAFFGPHGLTARAEITDRFPHVVTVPVRSFWANMGLAVARGVANPDGKVRTEHDLPDLNEALEIGFKFLAGAAYRGVLRVTALRETHKTA